MRKEKKGGYARAKLAYRATLIRGPFSCADVDEASKSAIATAGVFCRREEETDGVESCESVRTRNLKKEQYNFSLSLSLSLALSLARVVQ